jgi:hypothetical protein
VLCRVRAALPLTRTLCGQCGPLVALNNAWSAMRLSSCASPAADTAIASNTAAAGSHAMGVMGTGVVDVCLGKFPYR